MGILAEVNSNVVLAVTLWDADTTKGVRARVFDSTGTEISGSPFTLTHRSSGHYTGTGWNPTSEGQFSVSYEIYTDGTFATPDRKYEWGAEEVEVRSIDQDLATLLSRITATRAGYLDNLPRLDVNVSTREADSDALTRYNNVQSKLGTPAGASVSVDIASVKSDSSGLRTDYTTVRAAKLDNLDATVSSRSTQTSVDGINTKLGTPAGASVSADIASVKSDSSGLRTDYTTARAAKLDNLDATISSRASAASLAALDTKVGTPAGASVSADIASVKSDTSSLQSKLTTTRANNLDNLDATVSSRATQASVTSIQNNTNFVGVVPPTLVLPASGSKTYRMYVNLFNNNGSPEDPDSNIMNIRIENASGGALVSTTGMTRDGVGRYHYDYVVTSSDVEQSIRVFFEYTENAIAFQQVRTSEVQEFESKLDTLISRLTPTRAANLDNLDATVSSREAATAAATRESNILGRLGTPAGSSVSADIASVKSDSSGLRTDYTTTRALKLDNLDATVSSRASAASLASLDSKVGTPSTTIAGDISSVKSDTSSIKAKTDQLAFTGGRVDSVLSSTQEDTIVNKVWDEPVADHLLAGSMGLSQKTINDVKAVVDGISGADTNHALIVPSTLTLPETGSEVYRIYLRSSLRNEPYNPEVGPDIRIEKGDGSVVVDWIAMVNESIGIYYYDFTLNSTDTFEQLVIKARHKDHVTDTDYFVLFATTNVTSVYGDIADVFAQTTAIKAKTDQIIFTGGRVDSVLSTAQEDAIVDKVWDESSGGHTSPGSFGYNLDVPVSTREAETAAASRYNDISVFIAAAQTSLDEIQAQTDQMVFISGRIASSISSAQEDIIVDKVWDELLGGHTIPGSAATYLADAGSGTPSGVASAVWNAAITSHALPGTFGLYIDVIRQYALDNNNELANGSYGLAAIKSAIAQTGQDVINEANENQAAIEAIIPAVNAARNAVIAEVDQNQLKIEAIQTQAALDKAQIIGEINQNETKIDALSSQVGTIQNNTTTRFMVPEAIYRPDVGSKTYEFHLRLYDTVGNPEAPDSAPTIRIRRIDTGLDVVVGAVMSQLGANIGAYYYQFTVTSGTDLYQMLVEATVVENGITRLVPAVTEIVEFQSDLNAIQTQLTTVQGQTTDIQGKVNNPVFGLSALKTGQNTIVNEINQNEVKIDQVISKTSLLPANPASATDVAAVTAAVMTRPDLTQIVAQLNLIRDSIKGPDNRTVTDAYNKVDFTGIAKTNDPRFNFLDAAVSSRSTLSANDVWAYATRTLTSVVLPPAEVQKIWDVLVSQTTTPNSIGRRIVDLLDVAVSTRATQGQVASALSGVAQEATVSANFGQVDNTLALIQSATTLITNVVNMVKAKTDNLPASPASEATLYNETTQIDNAIANVLLAINNVKAKTDNLPPDPAKETSVQARPTNPVLSTDARLSRLDVNVSTRSSLTTADLQFLADDTELINARNLILTAVNDVLTGVTASNNLINQRPTNAQMDTKFLPIAKSTEVIQAKNDILYAINQIPSSGGSSLTAAQVWSYANRTLTASPTDISGLATSAQLAAIGTFYHNRMSTVFNNTSGNQEVIAWAERLGQRVVGEDCTVTVKTAAGVTKWSATLATPNADGVFRFENPLVVSQDQNFYIVVEIVVDGQVRVTHQPFFTVG